MVLYWLSLLSLKRGTISCTSWITCIANNLGLMRNATIVEITTDCPIIDITFFRHAHLLKKKGNKFVMIYKGFTTEIELLDPSFGLYVVGSFVLDLLRQGSSLGRSTSVRDTRNQYPHYQGNDAAPTMPAFVEHYDFNQSGPSRPQRASGWEATSPHHSETSGGTSWGQGNFGAYQEQEHEETSDTQGGRMSFSTHGYNEQNTYGPFPYLAPHPSQFPPPPYPPPFAPQPIYRPPPAYIPPPVYSTPPPAPPPGENLGEIFTGFNTRITHLEIGQEELRHTIQQQGEYQQQAREENQRYHEQNQSNWIYFFGNMNIQYPPPPPPPQ